MTLNNTQSDDRTRAEKKQVSYDRSAEILTFTGENELSAAVVGNACAPHFPLLFTIAEEFIDKLHDRHGDDIPAKYRGEGYTEFRLITLNIRDGHIEGVEIPSAVPEKTFAELLLSISETGTLTNSRGDVIDASDATSRLLVHAAEEMNGPGAQLLAEELTDYQAVN